MIHSARTKAIFLALASTAFGAFAAAAGNDTCRYIQRTMKSLENSTAKNPARLRVLFYGQSIVAQGWNGRIIADWKKRYPTAVIECRNPSIGGYTSPSLSRTAHSDLYPYYPDILFFHVYGPLDKYEEIIRTTRERTTAEIVLWSSHMGAKDDPRKMLAERDERTRGIEDIARRYRCMYVDLNRKWAEHLVAKGLEPKALLRDTIHLSKEAGALDLYAGFLNEDIVPVKGAEADWASGTVRTFAADDSCVRKRADGSVELTFDGNRVVGTVSAPGAAKVLLDGKPVETWPDMWCMTRPSASPMWMPAIRRVQWKVCPVREDWTLTYTADSDPDANPIRFTLAGSVSGDCGTGDTTADFLSPNGRVFVEKGDFGVGQYKQFRKKVKPGQTVTWKSLPMFALPCAADKKGQPVFLAQGCPNGRHVLTIRPEKGKALAFSSFTVHRPADVSRFPTASAVQGGTVVPSAKDMYENDPNHSKGARK